MEDGYLRSEFRGRELTGRKVSCPEGMKGFHRVQHTDVTFDAHQTYLYIQSIIVICVDVDENYLFLPRVCAQGEGGIDDSHIPSNP